MISFKNFIANSIRGASALASNQINTVLLPRINQTDERANNVRYKNLHSRSTGTYLSKGPSRLSKAQKAETASLEYDINLPQKPKKPPTPWITFMRERKDEILRHKSGMTAPAMTTILAKEWKEIDKSRYEEEFKRQLEEYHQKMDEYNNSLTDEHRDYLDLQKEFKREDRAKKQLRKTNPPVLPRNPANIYCHLRSQQDDIKQELMHRPPAQVFKDIFKEYRELPENEKQKYIGMQEEDKVRFQNEFSAWYEGIQNNENLSKTAREKADAIRDRFKRLNHI